MRETKFRMWFPKSKRMIHFEGLSICDEYDRLCFDISEADCLEEYEYLAGYSYIPNEEGLKMEFTGLKDKNGKEIYEGDIAKGLWDAELDYSTQIFAVEFRNGTFVENYFGRPLGDCVKNYHNGNTIEVIGNIYETPELIKA
jgi:uncharacterized phage protein (TIGR01671 family)